MELSRLPNNMINAGIIKALRTQKLQGTWTELDDIPFWLKRGYDTLIVAPTRVSLVTNIDELTKLMRIRKIPYRHSIWTKGNNAIALSFKVTCLATDKVCYGVSEENFNIIKEVRADKHYRIY